MNSFRDANQRFWSDYFNNKSITDLEKQTLSACAKLVHVWTGYKAVVDPDAKRVVIPDEPDTEHMVVQMEAPYRNGSFCEFDDLYIHEVCGFVQQRLCDLGSAHPNIFNETSEGLVQFAFYIALYQARAKQLSVEVACSRFGDDPSIQPRHWFWSEIKQTNRGSMDLVGSFGSSASDKLAQFAIEFKRLQPQYIPSMKNLTVADLRQMTDHMVSAYVLSPNDFWRRPRNASAAVYKCRTVRDLVLAALDQACLAYNISTTTQDVAGQMDVVRYGIVAVGPVLIASCGQRGYIPREVRPFGPIHPAPPLTLPSPMITLPTYLAPAPSELDDIENSFDHIVIGVGSDGKQGYILRDFVPIHTAPPATRPSPVIHVPSYLASASSALDDVENLFDHLGLGPASDSK